jgi:hypothetical protein
MLCQYNAEVRLYLFTYNATASKTTASTDNTVTTSGNTTISYRHARKAVDEWWLIIPTNATLMNVFLILLCRGGGVFVDCAFGAPLKARYD